MLEVNTELLKKRFEQSPLNYSDLARMTGLSRSTIYNVIFGETTPTLYVMSRLSIALELSKDDIIAIFHPYIKFEKELIHG